MKLSGLLVLPLMLGLASITVACDAGGNRETDEQLETEPRGSEDGEDEEEDGEEEGEGDDD